MSTPRQNEYLQCRNIFLKLFYTLSFSCCARGRTDIHMENFEQVLRNRNIFLIIHKYIKNSSAYHYCTACTRSP